MKILIVPIVLLSTSLSYAKEPPACHPVNDPKRLICATVFQYSGSSTKKTIIIPLRPEESGREWTGSASASVNGTGRPILINALIHNEAHGQNKTCDYQQMIGGDVTFGEYKVTLGRRTSSKVDVGFDSWIFELDMNCVIE